MMSSRGHNSGFPQQFIHPSCDWIHVLNAHVYSYFSWSLLSEAAASVIWCCNQWSPSPRERFSHDSWESILCTCQISKFHRHLCKFQALPSLRQIDQLRFLQLTISRSEVLSMVEVTKYVPHRYSIESSCSCEAFRLLSLSAPTGWYTSSAGTVSSFT